MHDDSLNADLVEALVAFARGYKEQIGRNPIADEFSKTLALVVRTTNGNDMVCQPEEVEDFIMSRGWI